MKTRAGPTLFLVSLFLLASVRDGRTAQSGRGEYGWGSRVGAHDQSRRARGRTVLLLARRDRLVTRVRKKNSRIKVKAVQGKGNELLVRIWPSGGVGRYLATMWRASAILRLFPYTKPKCCSRSPRLRSPESQRRTKWLWSGKHQYIDTDSKYIFVAVGSVSVNMVAHNTSSCRRPNWLFLGSLNEKMARQDRVMDPRSGGYGRAERAHDLLSSAIGRGIFAPAFQRAGRHGLADYRQAIDWIAQARSLFFFSATATIYCKPKRRDCQSTCWIPADGKKAAHWNPELLPWLGWTGRRTRTRRRFLSTGCCRARGK